MTLVDCALLPSSRAVKRQVQHLGVLIYASKEARDGALSSGMDEGMETCYQQLEGLLA
jgi:hypothetical protein